MNHTSVNVFRDAKFEAMNCDCTNNGLSHNVTDGLLFWDCTDAEAIAWCNENGYMPQLQFIIHRRDLWGEDHSYAEPLIKKKGAQMFGGNFLYTSNNNCFKFNGESLNRPIPIHDRFESWEMYNEMSI